METLSVWPVDLELRQEGHRPIIQGRFPYNETATIARTGRVRKERFASRAFDFTINQEPDREINFLFGHSFNRPLASRKAGTFELVDRADGVDFVATLPPDGEQPSWIVDFLRAHRAGLVRGISPGFAVAPRTAVANAEVAIPEPGNPGVFIRQINAAVLGEFSAVTRPTYDNTELAERSADLVANVGRSWQLDRELLRWL